MKSQERLTVTRVLIGPCIRKIMYTLADLNKRNSFAGKPMPWFGFKLKFKVKKHFHLKSDNLGIKRLDFKIRVE